MIVLLVLTAVLLVVSGVINLRAASRAGMSVHLFSLVELVGGLALAAVLLRGSLTPEQGLGAVLGAVLLIVGSSVHLGRRLRQLRKLRDLTEGRRLESYVKYLSEAPEEPWPNAGGDSSEPAP
jgi:hypothetical protein